MRDLGLIHERRRRPKGLTKATTEAQEKESLIKQDFSSVAPFKKVLTDITQVQCFVGSSIFLLRLTASMDQSCHC